MGNRRGGRRDDVLGSMQLELLRAFAAARGRELPIGVLFSIIHKNAVPGDRRTTQQAIGPTLSRLNQKLIRNNVRDRIRPGRKEGTYRLWPSEAEYLRFKERKLP